MREVEGARDRLKVHERKWVCLLIVIPFHMIQCNDLQQSFTEIKSYVLLVEESVQTRNYNDLTLYTI